MYMPDIYASAFLGVAVFFGVADFFGAAAFFFGAMALLVDAGAFDLVTRPDLVLPRTVGGLLSTAGASGCVSVRLGILAETDLQ